MPTAKPVPRTSLTTRTTCRICGSPASRPVLSLGDQCIAGAFAEPGGEQPVQRAIPMELVRCDMTRDQEACGLIQTKHTVPGSILYQLLLVPQRRQPHDDRQPARDRPGRRGDRRRSTPATSSSTSAATTARCWTATAREGLRYLGFDPSDVVRYASREGLRRRQRLLLRRAPARQRYADQKAKVVTSIAMFYDLEHPRDVRRRRRRGRSPTDGHLGHGAALPADDARGERVRRDRPRAPRVLLARRASSGCSPRRGSRSSHAELNDINGGSIRLFIGHAGQRERTARAGARAADAARPRVRAGARRGRALRGVPARQPSGSATTS